MTSTTSPQAGRLSPETTIVGQVAVGTMRQDLAWFAGHGLRLGGTAPEREAASYIVEHLRGAGVACDLEEFDAFVSYAEQPTTFGPATVRLGRPRRSGATQHPRILPACPAFQS